MVYSDKLLIFAAMLLEIFFYPGCGFILIGALSKNSGDPVAQQGKQQWIILGAIYFLVPFAMQFLAWLNVIIVPFMVFYSFCHLYSMVSVLRTIFKADAERYFQTPPHVQATTVVQFQQPIGVPQVVVQQQVHTLQQQVYAPQQVYAAPQQMQQVYVSSSPHPQFAKTEPTFPPVTPHVMGVQQQYAAPRVMQQQQQQPYAVTGVVAVQQPNQQPPPAISYV